MNNKGKALLLAAGVFLSSSCYLSSRDDKDNIKNIEPIKIVSVTPPSFINQVIITEDNTQKIEIPDVKEEIVPLEVIASEVIDGKWGNGELRKQLLTESGYDYNEVMNIVNEMLGYNKTNIVNESQIQSVISNINGKAAYLNCEEVLYDQNNNVICELSKYDKVILTDEYIGSKRLVTIPYLYQGYINNNSLTPLEDTYIEVDISLQVTRMFIDNELVFEADVITGNPNIGNIPGTNLGYSKILRKDYQTYLIGKDYKEYVDVFMPFNSSEEGFHDADGWRSDYEYDDKSRYLTNGSHGCVNMKDSDAKWLAENASVLTPVLIHK